MNILFIGPYKQNDGWGIAAQDFVQSLLRTKNNITLRPIVMSSNVSKNDKWKYLEYNLQDKYDVVIQNVLPHLFDFNRGFGLNIGLCDFETNDLKYTSWLQRCSNMDKIWINTRSESDMLKKANITHDIIPQPINVEKFYKDYKPFDFGNKDFVFYFIGELIDRKNIETLIRAYHTEFHRTEPVSLLIKTNGDIQNIIHYIDSIKSTMRLYANISDYKSEIIIADKLSEEGICAIHSSCHCFVSPSHGESACLPAMDALGFSNYVIGVENTGVASLKTTHLVESYDDYVYTKNPPLLDLYTSRETWKNISVKGLGTKMREVYNISKNSPKNTDGFDYIISEFNYDKVAGVINKCILQ